MTVSHTCFNPPISSDAGGAASGACADGHKSTLPAVRPEEPQPVQLEARVHDFVTANLGELLYRARHGVMARTAPRATLVELAEGIPLLFDRLREELRRPGADGVGAAASELGRRELSRIGLSVTQVVHDCVEVHGAVAELAAEANPWIARSELAALDRCLGSAIARTVGEYSSQCDRTIAADAAERIGTLAQEFRKRLSTAVLAFSLLKQEGIMRGRVADVLQRSLAKMTEHVDRVLAEVLLGEGACKRECISITNLVEEIELVASVEARARGLELSVTLPDEDVEVEGDKQLLGDAVVNLVNNAFKFTRPHGHVCLTTYATDHRVFIEVADECGGLPEKEDHERLFDRFVQRGEDRSGLGLGLAISRGTIEANGGKIAVRNRPGLGCVFVVDLPRPSASRSA